MIAKVSVGRSFGGVVQYLFEGRHDDLQANKQAEILAANGIRLGSVEQMISDFNRHRALNVDLGVAVWHTALSFHTDDREKLSDQLLIRLAEEYMSELQLEPTNVQWLLVKHNDTVHPHVHLLMNRVDYEGRTIDRSFCKARSRQAALRIARRHELIISTDRQQQKRQYGKIVTTEQSHLQQQVRQAIEQELPQVTTLTELAERLKPNNIAVHFQYRKKRKGESKGKNRLITGIVFETEGKFMRGSTLGEGFSAGTLTKRLGQRQRIETLSDKQHQLPKIVTRTTIVAQVVLPDKLPQSMTGGDNDGKLKHAHVGQHKQKLNKSNTRRF